VAAHKRRRKPNRPANTPRAAPSRLYARRSAWKRRQPPSPAPLQVISRSPPSLSLWVSSTVNSLCGLILARVLVTRNCAYLRALGFRGLLARTFGLHLLLCGLYYIRRVTSVIGGSVVKKGLFFCSECVPVLFWLRLLGLASAPLLGLCEGTAVVFI
jgi:hypothetical protein